MGLLAESYYALDRHAEALKLREETLEICRRVLPKDHPGTLWTMDALAKSYKRANRHEEALKLHQETLEMRRRVLPKDHGEILARMMDVSYSYYALGRDAEALELRKETLEIQRRVLPKDDCDTLVSIANLATSYVQAKRYDEALKLVEEFLPKADSPGVERGFYSQAIATRVQCYQKAGDLAGCRSTAELLEKRNPSDALSLYTAAYCRAITAAVQAKTPGADSARLAKVEAEKAMAWLTKAVAAGWKDAVHLKKDPGFKVLRDRDDFKKLISELEAKSK
jgi:tetratricopeptide (TPR) repeat protein